MNDILEALRSFYPEEYAMIEYLSLKEIGKFLEMAAYDAAYVGTFNWLWVDYTQGRRL
jgi:hypothetical protein